MSTVDRVATLMQVAAEWIQELSDELGPHVVYEALQKAGVNAVRADLPVPQAPQDDPIGPESPPERLFAPKCVSCGKKYVKFAVAVTSPTSRRYLCSGCARKHADEADAFDSSSFPDGVCFSVRTFRVGPLGSGTPDAEIPQA